MATAPPYETSPCIPRTNSATSPASSAPRSDFRLHLTRCVSAAAAKRHPKIGKYKIRFWNGPCHDEAICPRNLQPVNHGALPARTAGRLDWWHGWLLVGLSFASSLAASAVVWHDPELVAE